MKLHYDLRSVRRKGQPGPKTRIAALLALAEAGVKESGVFVADLANWTAIIQHGLRTLPEHNQLMPSNSSPQAHVQAWASARGLQLEIDEEANELRILDPLFKPKQTPPQAIQPRLFEE